MDESLATDDPESAVGITAFVSPDVPGFTCTVKQRYTDFLVNEILTDGTVLHLVNDSISKQGEVEQDDKDANGSAEKIALSNEASGDQSKKRHGQDDYEAEETRQKRARIDNSDVDTADNATNGVQHDILNGQDPQAPVSNEERKKQILSEFKEADKTALIDIFGEATTEQILNLHASVIIRPDRKPRDHPAVKSEPIDEKAKRTEAHVAVRRIFASKLETLTMQDLPGVISIKAAPTKGPSGARGQQNGGSSNSAYQKGKLGWSGLGGEYLHFTLYKENKDTMEVLFFLASQLKVPMKNFQFSGTKDRRGVTVQRVAIFRVHADRMAKLNKFARNWRLGDFKYEKHGLELGELNGNEFLLTLRTCRFTGDEGSAHDERMSLAKQLVEEATEAFQRTGFLNYYGLQRFGTFSTGTHTIGLKMLKGDLEGAVNAILAYSEDMLPENQDPASLKKVPQADIDRANAIRSWHTTSNSSSSAVNNMPKRFQAEAAMIKFLGKWDRKTGKMLQKQDWQGALMQIQRNLRLMYVHAYQSLVWNTVTSKRWELYGDRVVEGDLVIVGEKDGAQGSTKDEVDEDGEPIFHPAADDSAPTTEESFTRARPLTKEEATSGKYSVFDIVLPLPGYDVIYPANEVGKFYEEFMASEAGGEMDPHKMRRGWKDISLSGSYRKIMARPGVGFGFEVKSYADDDEQMVETDLERLLKKGGSLEDDTIGGAGGTGEDGGGEGGVPLNQEDDRKVAIVLKLQLGSSQYATMALRELTKGGAINYKPDYSAR